VLDGTSVPLLHRSQLATLLDLPRPDEPEPETLAWDCAALHDAWIAGIADLDLPALLAPTRSRGRSLRNLTVNVLHSFELVPDAWAAGRFDWDPDRDAEREAALDSAAAVVAYASAARDGWLVFLSEAADALDGTLPVNSPRGPLAFGDLLAQQRWHAAFHYRQLVAHRAETGRPLVSPFPLERLDALDLPADVF
jgi:hypothetical protein